MYYPIAPCCVIYIPSDADHIKYVKQLLFYNKAKRVFKNIGDDYKIIKTIKENNIDHHMMLETLPIYKQYFCDIVVDNEEDVAYLILCGYELFNTIDDTTYSVEYSIIENSHNFLFEDN